MKGETQIHQVDLLHRGRPCRDACCCHASISSIRVIGLAAVKVDDLSSNYLHFVSDHHHGLVLLTQDHLLTQ